MKVLRVVASMDPRMGGICQGIRNSAPAVAKLGHSTEVVSLDDPSAPFVSQIPFPIHALGARRGPWGYNSALEPWLRQNLPRFDAVIVEGLWLYPSFAVHRAIRHLRCNAKAPPYYVMPHGMLDPWFQRARPLKAIRNTIYWKLIEHRTIRDASALLFTCEEEMRLAREPFQPYHPARELVTGFGIARPTGDARLLARCFREKFAVVGQRPFLLFLSRVHSKKGMDLLLRGYARLFENAATDAASGIRGTKGISDFPSLVIAGPCSEPTYLSSLKQLANSLGLRQFEASGIPANEGGATGFPCSSVIWLPMLSGDDKWGVFHACDAFVLPSHQENFGIAVVEAMACGKPVLISDKVNIWREIERDGGGVVCSDTLGGVSTLLDKWLTLSQDERLAMGQSAQRCFAERFQIEKASKSLVRALEGGPV